MQLQRDKLQVLESRLLGCEETVSGSSQVRKTRRGPAKPKPFIHFDSIQHLFLQGENLEEEVLLLEQKVRSNDAKMEEEEFWQNEMLIEQENEQQLRQQLAELRRRVSDCEAKLSGCEARIEVSCCTVTLCDDTERAP